jgi:hypothetical protein
MAESLQYMPSSGTEGADFEAKWCMKCVHDENADYGDGCRILADAYAGTPPSVWSWWRGEPLCSAFKATDPADRPHLAGDAVADLFPGSHRRPTTGEQVRMLVLSAASGGSPNA